MTIDERLARKGKNEPRVGLMQQGKVHIGLAGQFAAELAANGWAPEDTLAFESNVAALDSTIAAQAEGKLTARAALKTEAGSIEEAKEFIGKLRNALPRALREAKEPGLVMSAFAPGETLGRSTAKLSAYLTRIQPAVAKLDDHLKKHFAGSKASEVLAATKSALDGADVKQEIAWKSLPKETRLVCETKGRVLEGIEDLNRAAKSAFAKQPETAALFSKELLERARQERKAAAKPGAKAPKAAPAEAKAPEAAPAEAKAPEAAPAEGNAGSGSG